jgi:hypothetical protein
MSQFFAGAHFWKFPSYLLSVSFFFLNFQFSFIILSELWWRHFNIFSYKIICSVCVQHMKLLLIRKWQRRKYQMSYQLSVKIWHQKLHFHVSAATGKQNSSRNNDKSASLLQRFKSRLAVFGILPFAAWFFHQGPPFQCLARHVPDVI